jgi:hypothetical protein
MVSFGEVDRERLRNALTWIEYRSFDETDYDALLHGIEFGGGYELDVGKLDFEREQIELTWCYTDMQEAQRVEEASEVFNALFEQSFLSGEDAEDRVKEEYIHADEVTSVTWADAPTVHGEVLTQDGKSVAEDMRELSGDIFDRTYSGRNYDVLWVEGERLYD